jgi:hypothetical protein
MSIELLAQRLESQIQQVCQPLARYRVLWVIGSPRAGKTSLCRFVCQHRVWKYVDFTLEPGFLDRLIGQEEIYRPEDFLELLHLLCDNISEEVIVLDEIEPLLGLWTWEQRELFFKQVGYATRLKTGVVVATRLSNTQELTKLVPGSDHIFEIPQGVEL